MRANPAATPDLKMLDDLNLISSAGSGDQLFGAFLYSNACGRRRPAGRRPAGDRSWGMTNRPRVGRPCGPDLERRHLQVDRHRAVRAAPGSSIRTRADSSRPAGSRNWGALDRRSRVLDRSVGDPRHQHAEPRRSVRLASGRRSAAVPDRRDDPPRQRSRSRATPTSWHASSYEPPIQPVGNGSASDQHDVSSLATLWMARFLIQLGRETGQARHWTRAVSMLEGIFGRLSQLGLSLRHRGRGIESARQVSNPGGTAWRLHAMLIDTILDLAGFDYDAVERPVSGPYCPANGPRPESSSRFPAATSPIDSSDRSAARSTT